MSTVTPPRFWAKLGSSCDAEQHHPVIAHLLDTAAVARAIYTLFLSDTTRRLIRDGLGLSDDADCALWIGFLAGTHDTGKVSPAFQFQVPEVGRELVGTEAFLAWLRASRRPFRTPHGAVTALTLPSYLAACGIDSSLSKKLGAIVGGHHGFFPTVGELENLREEQVGEDAWPQFRHDVLDALAAHSGLNQAMEQPSRCDPPAAMVLAGLTTVADWIASNSDLFPYAPDETLAVYAESLDHRAAAALKALGWIRPSGEPKSFASLFPWIEAPRPLQQAAIALAETVKPPALVLIEAAMGEGKTEAALHLADYWQHAHGLGGFFTALPTQATSNQMWQRVRDFLQTRHPSQFVNLTLVHGQALLRDEYLETVCRLDRQDQVYDQDGAVMASEWHTARKRTLLSPYGVGTVDQGLMGVLRARHQFVRLFGLAGRCIIIDEIHAYDLYTSTLLERFMTWMAVLGSPVVALSATLPSESRQRLLQAYADGLQLLDPLDDSASYPRLSVVSRDGVAQQSFQAAPHVRREVALRWLDKSQTAQEIAARVREGGNVAVICSTVNQAQAMYRSLAEHIPATQRDLFHGRFLVHDRQAIEHRCLNRFGKSSDRPDGFVLVATQVIEQSLDVDFDLMISDLAPIDLLLQRSGRLHRHVRDKRPIGMERPELWLLTPERLAGGTPDFDAAGHVYDAHVLLRTWLTLQSHPVLRLPTEMDALIESVYRLEHLPPDTLDDALRTLWQASLEKHLQHRENMPSLASNVYIPHPHFDQPLSDFTSKRYEDDEAEFNLVTRLGDKSVMTIMLRHDGNDLYLPRSGRRIARDHPPDPETIRDLLLHSVRLSQPAVVKALDKVLPLPGWSSALLRACRPLILDEQGACVLGNYLVRLDDDLGVVYEQHIKES
jgi:CRISPR-associated endonuclease/helicase Cas3